MVPACSQAPKAPPQTLPSACRASLKRLRENPHAWVSTCGFGGGGLVCNAPQASSLTKSVASKPSSKMITCRRDGAEGGDDALLGCEVLLSVFKEQKASLNHPPPAHIGRWFHELLRRFHEPTVSCKYDQDFLMTRSPDPAVFVP